MPYTLPKGIEELCLLICLFLANNKTFISLIVESFIITLISQVIFSSYCTPLPLRMVVGEKSKIVLLLWFIHWCYSPNFAAWRAILYFTIESYVLLWPLGGTITTYNLLQTLYGCICLRCLVAESWRIRVGTQRNCFFRLERVWQEFFFFPKIFIEKWHFLLVQVQFESRLNHFIFSF